MASFPQEQARMRCNQLRRGTRFVLCQVACFATCLIVVSFARADKEPADKARLEALWRTYFNSAILEVEASQNAPEVEAKKDRSHNALILLESALDTANRIDPDGPRPRMTVWLEYLTYYGIGEGETAEKVLKTSKAVDLKNFGADLLPVASALEGLGDTYINHADDQVYIKGNEYFGAFKCFQFDIGILTNAYGAYDTRLAMPTALFGLAQMRLGDFFYDQANEQKDEKARDSDRKSAEAYLQGAIQAYQGALQVWTKNHDQDMALSVSNQRYMVSQLEAKAAGNRNRESPIVASQAASDVEGPNDVNNVLSNTYEKLGDLYTLMKQDDKAQEQYKKAEAPLVSVLNTLDARWPNHPARAREQNMFAILYLRQKRYADAERLFRQALQTTEQSQGKDAADTKLFAENLVYCLKQEHRDSDAQSVAREYSVKAD